MASSTCPLLIALRILGGGLASISIDVVPVREVRLCAGAEFLVVVCGDIMTMPGLPVKPSAHDIHVNENGEIEGLF